MGDSSQALRQYLVDLDEMHRKADHHGVSEWPFQSMEGFILHYGVHWTPAALPKGFKRMEIKQCYRNATLLLEDDEDLAYCEGYACGIIPVHHAWCVTPDGRVIDPTWNPVGTAYIGVPFDTQFILERLQTAGTYSVIDDWQDTFPLLRGEVGPEDFLHPLFRDEIEKRTHEQTRN